MLKTNPHNLKYLLLALSKSNAIMKMVDYGMIRRQREAGRRRAKKDNYD